MKKRIKILLALAASVAAIAIGQRSNQSDRSDNEVGGEDGVRTERALVEEVEDADAWFI